MCNGAWYRLQRSNSQIGVHAGGVALCKRTCFYLLSTFRLLSAFYDTLASKNPSKNLVFTESPHRRLLRTPLRSALAFKEPSKNPSKERIVAWTPWCAPYKCWLSGLYTLTVAHSWEGLSHTATNRSMPTSSWESCIVLGGTSAERSWHESLLFSYNFFYEKCFHQRCSWSEGMWDLKSFWDREHAQRLSSSGVAVPPLRCDVPCRCVADLSTCPKRGRQKGVGHSHLAEEQNRWKQDKWTSTTWLDIFVGTSVDAVMGRFVGAFVGSPWRAESKENQPSWMLSWALSWRHLWVHSWVHSWAHFQKRKRHIT